ncbi:MAG: hypothetical protein HYV35_10205 [Lentisphaerae bacterium]|nr:hypothetical protein [Lentisphaerota bacterium]
MMMKSIFVLVTTAGLLCAWPAGAATLATSDSRETIFTQHGLDNLSLGGMFEILKRDMQEDRGGGKIRLQAYNYYGYLGYDFWERLTLFGTVGASQAKTAEDDEHGNAGVKWSAGLNLKIWHIDLNDPTFIAGRYSIRAMSEYSHYRSGEKDATWFKWQDLYAALTVNYEIFVAEMSATEKYPYSLLLYLGPAISSVDGKQETSNQTNDFSEEHTIGIAAGVDLFASHNLSLGGQLQFYFDEPTVSVSVIYNF